MAQLSAKVVADISQYEAQIKKAQSLGQNLSVNLKTQEFDNGLKKVLQGFNQINSMSKMLGAGLSVAGVVAFEKEFIHAGAAVYDMSKRLGVGIQSVQKLSYAAKETGSDMETVAKAVLKTQAALSSGGGGETGRLAEGLKALGLTAKELQGLSPEEFLLKVAEAFDKCGDRGTANSAAINIFGGRVSQMIPLLERGRQGIDDLFADAPAMGDETIKKLKELNTQFEKLGTQGKTGLGTLLLPVLQGLMAIGVLLNAGAQSAYAFWEALAKHKNPITAINAWKDTFKTVMHEGGKSLGAYKLDDAETKQNQESVAADTKALAELQEKRKAAVLKARSQGLKPSEQSDVKAIDLAIQTTETRRNHNRAVLDEAGEKSTSPKTFGDNTEIGETTRIAHLKEEIADKERKAREASMSDEQKLNDLIIERGKAQASYDEAHKAAVAKPGTALETKELEAKIRLLDIVTQIGSESKRITEEQKRAAEEVNHLKEEELGLLRKIRDEGAPKDMAYYNQRVAEAKQRVAEAYAPTSAAVGSTTPVLVPGTAVAPAAPLTPTGIITSGVEGEFSGGEKAGSAPGLNLWQRAIIDIRRFVFDLLQASKRTTIDQTQAAATAAAGQATSLNGRVPTGATDAATPQAATALPQAATLPAPHVENAPAAKELPPVPWNNVLIPQAKDAEQAAWNNVIIAQAKADEQAAFDRWETLRKASGKNPQDVTLRGIENSLEAADQYRGRQKHREDLEREFGIPISPGPAHFGGGTGSNGFVTHGPQAIIVGDNPGGVERVTVEPLSGKGETNVTTASANSPILSMNSPGGRAAKWVGKIGHNVLENVRNSVKSLRKSLGQEVDADSLPKFGGGTGGLSAATGSGKTGWPVTPDDVNTSADAELAKIRAANAAQFAAADKPLPIPQELAVADKPLPTPQELPNVSDQVADKPLPTPQELAAADKPLPIPQELAVADKPLPTPQELPNMQAEENSNAALAKLMKGAPLVRGFGNEKPSPVVFNNKIPELEVSSATVFADNFTKTGSTDKARDQVGPQELLGGQSGVANQHTGLSGDLNRRLRADDAQQDMNAKGEAFTSGAKGRMDAAANAALARQAGESFNRGKKLEPAGFAGLVARQKQVGDEFGVMPGEKWKLPNQPGLGLTAPAKKAELDLNKELQNAQRDLTSHVQNGDKEAIASTKSRIEALKELLTAQKDLDEHAKHLVDSLRKIERSNFTEKLAGENQSQKKLDLQIDIDSLQTQIEKAVKEKNFDLAIKLQEEQNSEFKQLKELKGHQSAISDPWHSRGGYIGEKRKGSAGKTQMGTRYSQVPIVGGHNEGLYEGATFGHAGKRVDDWKSSPITGAAAHMAGGSSFQSNALRDQTILLKGLKDELAAWIKAGAKVTPQEKTGARGLN